MKVTFRQKFTVCFRTYKSNRSKVHDLLRDNKFKFEEKPCIFQAFINLEVNCNSVKRFYLLYMLLDNENISIYE